MMSMKSPIIHNLDQFIRKYYKNRLLKGLLLSVAMLVALFLVIVLVEYFGYLSVVLRTLLFWLYVTCMAVVVFYYIVVPLLKMCRMGKVISYEEAAQIVGNHFPEIKDKLLNLLQLQKETSTDGGPGRELLIAAIEQKSAQLSPIPFANAVDFKTNRRYLRYALVSVVALATLLIVAPKSIVDPSRRLVNHNVVYEKPAPFAFLVLNKCLETAQQEDFLLQVEIEGDAIPNEAFVNIEGRKYKMQQQDKTHYSYLFKNLQHTTVFNLYAAGVTSAEYRLDVFPKPMVVDFQLAITYPSYMNKEKEVLSNVGDITVPQGAAITWQFQTKDVDTLYFLGPKGFSPTLPNANGRLAVHQRAMETFGYGFFVQNSNFQSSDTLLYTVSVVEDCAPLIMAMELRDSLTPNRIFFKGRIKDDYGFTKLEFKLVKTSKQDTSKHETLANPVAITRELSQEFYYSVNLNEILLEPGDRLSYFFEVWDNDGIHGPKSSTSQTFEIEVPTDAELEETLDRNYDKIKDEAEQSIGELKKIQKEIDELMRQLVDKKELNWQDKKQLEQLVEKQKEVKETLQKMQKQIEENNRLEEQYRQQSEQIMEKQRELDKLFDQVMTDEMKDMMKEIEKLMQEQDKKKVQEQLENLKLKNEDIERQIDQNIELMKRLELEKKVEDIINKVDKLSDKQKDLAEKTEKAKNSEVEQLEKQQEQLNNDFQELKKELDEVQKEYKKLDESADFKVDKELEQKIEQNQKNAQKNLEKGKKNDASKQQRQAAEDMEKLSEQIAEAQMDMEQEDLAEDSEQVRHLLKNLVRISFNQEDLIKKVNEVYVQDPQYQQIIKLQDNVRVDFRTVADSLQAMAKRQIAIASVINKELGNVNSNISKSLSGLLQYNQTFYGNMKNGQAARSMQYAMTSLNNLALILAESLDQMQNQMRQNQQQKKQGSCKKQGMKMKSGSCSKPGSGKPSPKSMKQMQDELNKQMEALKKQLDKQGNKPGGRPKLGQQNSMSEEFAKMAAQQEQIRRMMQQYGQEMKQQNGGNSKLAKEINEMIRQMEQTETDLVNKTITNQTIKRQQQIMTRLLEHEKAEMKREKEERRESHEGKELYNISPSDLERLNKMQEKNLELFKSVPPALSPFYKNKVNDYFYKF